METERGRGGGVVRNDILCNGGCKDKVMHELDNSSTVSWLGSIGGKHVRMIDGGP